MTNKTFSHNLSKIILLIAMVPVICGAIFVVLYVGKSQIKEVIRTNAQSLEKQAENLIDTANVFYRIKSTLIGDAELSQFLLKGGERSITEVIPYLREETNSIEQLTFLYPNIYSIHLFTADSKIPERWPVFFSEKRLTASLNDPWQFNFKSEAMPTFEPSKDVSACFTQELLINKKHVGYLQISMRMESLFPFLYPDKDQLVRNYLIYNRKHIANEKEVLCGASLSNQLLEKIIKTIDLPSDGQNQNVLKIEKHIILWKQIPNLNLVIITDCSLKEVYQQRWFVISISIIIISIILVAIIIITNLTAGRMLHDLNYLLVGLKKVQKGDLDIRIPEKGTHELKDTAQAFNQTVVQLKNSIEDMKKEQELVIQTEIKAMQNQINGHFLYNVLETIKMQAELANQTDIVESITLVGRMLRYCLRWKKVFVNLQDELSYVQSYISILNIRNDYQISLVINIPPELQNCEIPKMIIQPIVENAFMHGIEHKEIDSLIEIFAKLDESTHVLWISIRDYGVGMDDKELSIIRDKLKLLLDEEKEKGIGLINIQQRLYEFYGKEYKLHFESVLDLGTLVQIPIPYKSCQCEGGLQNAYTGS